MFALTLIIAFVIWYQVTEDRRKEDKRLMSKNIAAHTQQATPAGMVLERRYPDWNLRWHKRS
jgi:hypothetical protein